MNKNELTKAIEVAENELIKLTHETLRPSQGFKMRTHSQIMAAIITCLNHYKAKLKELPKESKADPKATRKED